MNNYKEQLQTILDLCLSKSHGENYYLFEYNSFLMILTLKKYERCGYGGYFREWLKEFNHNQLTRAIDLMESE